MKETVRDRLLQFINELGISTRMFEQNCGLSNGFVRNTGDSIRRNNLEKISTIYPDLNTTWLLTGDGNKFFCEIYHFYFLLNACTKQTIIQRNTLF